MNGFLKHNGDESFCRVLAGPGVAGAAGDPRSAEVLDDVRLDPLPGDAAHLRVHFFFNRRLVPYTRFPERLVRQSAACAARDAKENVRR